MIKVLFFVCVGIYLGIHLGSSDDYVGSVAETITADVDNILAEAVDKGRDIDREDIEQYQKKIQQTANEQLQHLKP
jgi:CBS-domain-containing membrane protein